MDKITTEILLRGAVMFAMADVLYVGLLVWRVKPMQLRAMMLELPVVGGVVYSLIWLAVGAIVYWDTVYVYVFPGWLRWWLPIAQGLLSGVVVLIAAHAAARTRRSTLVFLLCGGLWGMLSHIWAVTLGIVDKPPPLQGASPVAAVVVAIFEFMFYWCVILTIAVAVSSLHRRARPEGLLRGRSAGL